MAKAIIATARPERRYEVEDAMRTLTRAEEIKRDAKLMKDVRELASDLKRVVGREPAVAKRRKGK
jgi:hypothetical protein